MTTLEKLSNLRDGCRKALTCLYIAVPEDVAADVNATVKGYITTLEAEIERLEKENAKLKSALENICRYPIHSEPVGGAMAMQDIAQEALK